MGMKEVLGNCAAGKKPQDDKYASQRLWARTAAIGIFRKADTNHDKKLSSGEWMASPDTPHGDRGAALLPTGGVKGKVDKAVKKAWKGIKGKSKGKSPIKGKKGGCTGPVQTEFDIMDMDHDCAVTKAEWIRHFGPDKPTGFSAFDTNGDGFVNAQEWVTNGKTAKQTTKDGSGTDIRAAGQPYPNLFSMYDSNHDGWVSYAEWMEWRVYEFEFTLLDTNNDREISRSEWKDRYGSESGYDAIDANHDSALTPKEWRKKLADSKLLPKKKKMKVHSNSNEMLKKLEIRLSEHQKYIMHLHKAMAWKKPLYINSKKNQKFWKSKADAKQENKMAGVILSKKLSTDWHHSKDPAAQPKKGKMGKKAMEKYKKECAQKKNMKVVRKIGRDKNMQTDPTQEAKAKNDKKPKVAHAMDTDAKMREHQKEWQSGEARRAMQEWLATW